MRLLCLLFASLSSLLYGAGLTLADRPTSRSPLRLVPSEADVVVQIPDPNRLVVLARSLQPLQQLVSLPAVQEQLDATGVRRLRQLLAHFEKSLGMKWPALVDKLVGGGIALGAKLGNDAPAVLVLQGTDEKVVEQFVALAAEIVEGELARQESKDKLQKGEYHGIPGYRLGNIWVARVGAALVLSNHKESLARALHLHLGKQGKSFLEHPALADAAKLLPSKPLLSAWLNMTPIQKSPQGKELYASPRDNGILTVLIGSYLDLLGRTPYLTAGLSETKEGFLFTIRAPRGTQGMGADRLLHLPPEGKPGSKPLLQPKGVLYSSSFYLDLANIWTEREKLFPKVQADGLTQTDKNSARFLAGMRLSTLLESVGPYHRLVVVNPAKRPYAREPKVRIPAFAFVAELRQPEKFARAMDTLLRTVALFVTQTFKMELVEEQHDGFDLVGYRFDEKAEVKDDVNDIRYNFSPCFVRVGKQFIFSSTMELCKELIPQLVAEEKSPGPSNPARVQDRYDSQGFADLLRSIDDQLITQTILDQAVPPAQAKKQVDQLIEWVRGLGSLTATGQFDPQQFRFDLRLRLKK